MFLFLGGHIQCRLLWYTVVAVAVAVVVVTVASGRREGGHLPDRAKQAWGKGRKRRAAAEDTNTVRKRPWQQKRLPPS